MRFPFGKPIFVLLLLAIAGGAGVWTLRPLPRADLLVWCFAENHAQTFNPAVEHRANQPLSLVEQFHRASGHTVAVELIGQQAEDIRLISLFMSQASGPIVPDLCEIEIGSIAKFFRAPVDDMGLLPLNDYLTQSGEFQRLLPSRLALWSKRDAKSGKRVYFGVPDDVHPTTFTYRKDLFDEAGLDPTQDDSWAKLQTTCLKLQRYLADHGHPTSRAMELSTTNPNQLVMMLLQRHVNLVDSANRVHLADPKVADTLAFYAQLVSGPGAIGADTSPAGGLWAKDLLRGDVCSLITPDWRAGNIAQFAPELKQKLRMMPLPRFDPDDAPTSTSGGTMVGIPRATKDPRLAWQLLEHLYLSPQAHAARIAAGTDIIPPEPALWSDPLYHQPSAFFGGQKVSELYIQLAAQIPEREVTPYTTQAEFALALVLYKARNHIEKFGAADLHANCTNWLNQAQEELQRRINFGRFEP